MPIIFLHIEKFVNGINECANVQNSNFLPFYVCVHVFSVVFQAINNNEVYKKLEINFKHILGLKRMFLVHMNICTKLFVVYIYIHIINMYLYVIQWKIKTANQILCEFLPYETYLLFLEKCSTTFISFGRTPPLTNCSTTIVSTVCFLFFLSLL